MVTSWLGYAHSCFNPLIYTAFNKNFQRTLKLMLTGKLAQILQAQTPGPRRRSRFGSCNLDEMEKHTDGHKAPRISVSDSLAATPKNSVADM